jgi:hypothetical protein
VPIFSEDETKKAALLKLLGKSTLPVAAGAVGAAALTPEESEAGIFDRKMLDELVKKVLSEKAGYKVQSYDLAKALQLSANDTSQNLRKSGELLGHLLLNKHGVAEDTDIIQLLLKEYPEAKNLEFLTADTAKNNADVIRKSKILNEIYPGAAKKRSTKNLGEFYEGTVDTDIGEIRVPTGIALNKDMNTSPIELAATAGHEGQHLRDLLLHPDKKSIKYRKPQLITDINNNESDFAKGLEVLENVTKKHHIEYPFNYEIDRAVDIINKTEPIHDPKKLDDAYQQLMEQYKYKTGNYIAPTDLSKENPLEVMDRVAGKPLRNAAGAFLNKENPFKAAVSDKETTGDEIAKKFLEISEEAGMPLRAPGQEEFPLQKPLGVAAELGLDATNLIPGAQLGKFNKLKKVIK